MKKIYDLIIRYTILILAGISNFYIFYLIFTPLTIYPVYLLFSLFFKTTLIGKTILVNKILIELIPACIAGSAYYLLLILNLSIPNIKIKKRIEMIAFAFSFFLIINVLRIFFLGFIYDSTWFDFAHKFFWYFLKEKTLLWRQDQETGACCRSFLFYSI